VFPLSHVRDRTSSFEATSVVERYSTGFMDTTKNREIDIERKLRSMNTARVLIVRVFSIIQKAVAITHATAVGTIRKRPELVSIERFTMS
jgi:hypothetical protein